MLDFNDKNPENSKNGDSEELNLYDVLKGNKDFDYKSAMANIKKELSDLNNEANDLAKQIKTNLEDLGL